MRKLPHLTVITAFLFAGLSLTGGTASASHHFESPLAKEHPALDLTDLYVFNTPDKARTIFILDVNPKTAKEGPAQFADRAVYNFHIAADREMKSGKTLTVSTMGGELVFGWLDGANQAVGAIGSEFGRAAVGTEATFSNGVHIWTGAARDPFVGNSAGIGGFRDKLGAGCVDLSPFDPGVDLFLGMHTSAIVVEVPNTLLPPKIWVYASSAFYATDKWEQVNRIALPLMTHLFLYNNPMEIFEHVGHRPDIDAGRRYALSANVLRAVSLDGKMSHPVRYADEIAERLLPDMLPYIVGTPAVFSVEEINGRPTQGDAMDVMLSLFLGRKVTDHANTFDRHPGTFPYLQAVK